MTTVIAKLYKKTHKTISVHKRNKMPTMKERSEEANPAASFATGAPREPGNLTVSGFEDGRVRGSEWKSTSCLDNKTVT